ncbi:hypothetical protein [Bacillus sp. 0102A]|uniref:hypothetical protein n=1 Tax=Bacillus sp. 0102A TaxID=3120563 RepID=UPI002FDB486C
MNYILKRTKKVNSLVHSYGRAEWTIDMFNEKHDEICRMIVRAIAIEYSVAFSAPINVVIEAVPSSSSVNWYAKSYYIHIPPEWKS